MCTTPGAIGALLRRERLYASRLGEWRRARHQDGSSRNRCLTFPVPPTRLATLSIGPRAAAAGGRLTT